MRPWMIYGATGYTGQLIAAEAVARGLTPVLAGRREDAVRAVAEPLGLPWAVAPLDDPRRLRSAVGEVAAVLHAAGPFRETSAPMLDAVLATGADYLDITGEVVVFERIFGLRPQLVRRGVRAIPGVGFDVVPTDAVAAQLARAVPDAVALELGFLGLGGLSGGTAASAIGSLDVGGLVRSGGRLVRVPVGHRTRRVVLAGKPRTLVSIPWGDVSTAWHSTGIPAITTYAAVPEAVAPWLRRLGPFAGLAAFPPVRRLLQRLVKARLWGPSAEARARGASHVWGEVTGADGRTVSLHLTTPEGYALTATASVAAVVALDAGEVPPGPHTPSTAFGADFALGLPGVSAGALETTPPPDVGG
jgi:short subunit dehydrogenase-like uncharacterized protein